MDEIRVLLFHFNHFHFLSEVFRIGLSIKVSISRVSIPIVASSKLIREVGIVIFFRLFGFKFVHISAFASQRKITSCVLISRFHILVITFMARKLSWVRCQIWWWTIAMQQIFWMRSFKLISIFPIKTWKIGRVHVKMRSLEAVVLLSKNYRTLNSFLIVETFSIDGSLGNVWLNDMKTAQMSST